MALPKLQHPTFELKLPSNGKKIHFRPFTVKEEKILLFAQQDGSQEAILQAFRQLITNCVTEKIDVDKMASFDIEWLFIKLRSASVSNIAKINIQDMNNKGLQETVELTIDLEKDVTITTKKVDPKVVLSEQQDLGVKLRYPTFDAVAHMTSLDKADPTAALAMYDDVIDVIWEGDTVYTYSDYSREEKNEFLESLTESAIDKIQQFLEDMPYVSATVKYKLSTGEDKELEIRGLQSFFG